MKKFNFKNRNFIVAAITCTVAVVAGTAVLAFSPRLKGMFDPKKFERFEDWQETGEDYDSVAGDGQDSDLADESEDGQDRSDDNLQDAVEAAQPKLEKLSQVNDQSEDSIGKAREDASDEEEKNPNAAEVTPGEDDDEEGSPKANGDGGSNEKQGNGKEGEDSGDEKDKEDGDEEKSDNPSDGDGDSGKEDNQGEDSQIDGGQDKEEDEDPKKDESDNETTPQKQPDEDPQPDSEPAPQPEPSWEEEQLVPKEDVVTEDGELTALSVDAPENWTFCYGDSFREEDVTVKAVFKKDGKTTEKVLPYGEEGYSVNFSTRSLGSYFAVFTYMGVTARVSYKVLSANLTLRYFAYEEGGMVYIQSFPGPLGLSDGTMEKLTNLHLYPTSGSVVDLYEMHRRLIAYLGDSDIINRFNSNAPYNKVEFLEEEDGYLANMLSGFYTYDIDTAQWTEDAPCIYYPAFDWGDNTSKRVADVPVPVPEGFKIKRTAEKEEDDYYYMGDQVLVQYTGGGSAIQVPLGVTKLALEGKQGKGEKITSLEIPESVGSIEADQVGQALPDLEEYTVTGYSSYSVVDGALYSRDKKVLLSVPPGKKELKEWPDQVKRIASNAFYGSKIESLEVPASVRILDEGCFNQFDAEQILFYGEEVPDQIGETGYHNKILVEDSPYDRNLKNWMFAFRDEAITFGAMDASGNELKDRTGIYSYSKDMEVLVWTENTKLLAGIPADERGRYVVPDGIQGIGKGAFAGCGLLYELDFPASVATLEENSLILGENVASITLEAPMASIDPNAFGRPEEGAALPDVTIYVPADYYEDYLDAWGKQLDATYGKGTAQKLLAPYSDVYVYENDAKYEKIDQDGQITYRLLKVYNQDFSSFQVKEGTTEVEPEAFSLCSRLEIVYLPESLKELKTGALSGCEALETVVLNRDNDSVIKDGAWDAGLESQVKLFDTDSGYESYGYYGGIIYGAKGDGEEVLLNVPTDFQGTLALRRDTAALDQEACKNCQGITGLSVEEGKKLVRIGESCFENCTGLLAVNLESCTGLGEIGTYAFRSCSALSALVLPESVTETAEGMCSGCTVLDTVNLPGVEKIGAESFYQCGRLRTMEFSQEGVADIGDRAFSYCNAIKEWNAGGSLKTIGDQAFMCCASLSQIVLPETLETMGEEAFSECTSLTKVEVEGSLTAISRYAFYGCRSLAQVSFGKKTQASLKVVGVQAFGLCSQLESLDFTGMAALSQIGERAFSGCSYLTYLTLPPSVAKLGKRCMEDCENLSILTLLGDQPPTLEERVFGDEVSPFAHIWVKEGMVERYYSNYKEKLDGEYGQGTALSLLGEIDKEKEIIRGVTYLLKEEGRILSDAAPALSGSYTILSDTVRVEEEAFAGCDKLTEIIFPDGSKVELGKRCFKDCTALRTVDIGGSVTKWEEDTFQGCTSLEEVYLGKTTDDKIEEIGTRAFKDCAMLTDLSMRADVRAIGEECFSGCTSFRGISMTDSSIKCVEEIKAKAFLGCTGLVSVVTSKYTGLKTIGEYAFADCDKLANPSVPANVASLGEGCFSGCDNILTVSFYCTLSAFPKNCFKNCPKLTRTGGVAEALSGLKKIEESTYEGCTSLVADAKWDLGKYTNLEEIGKNAFKGCTSLTEADLAATVNRIGSGAFDDSGLLTLTLHSATPPAIEGLSLDALPEGFGIRVEDSQEAQDEIYKAYLAMLGELIGEEKAKEILDSISDGARERALEAKEISETGTGQAKSASFLEEAGKGEEKKAAADAAGPGEDKDGENVGESKGESPGTANPEDSKKENGASDWDSSEENIDVPEAGESPGEESTVSFLGLAQSKEEEAAGKPAQSGTMEEKGDTEGTQE